MRASYVHQGIPSDASSVHQINSNLEFGRSTLPVGIHTYPSCVAMFVALGSPT